MTESPPDSAPACSGGKSQSIEAQHNESACAALIQKPLLAYFMKNL
jgi:hypothetical protein